MLCVLSTNRLCNFVTTTTTVNATACWCTEVKFLQHDSETSEYRSLVNLNQISFTPGSPRKGHRGGEFTCISTTLCMCAALHCWQPLLLGATCLFSLCFCCYIQHSAFRSLLSFWRSMRVCLLNYLFRL